ncbi:uncharacterized protein MKK02DRAFT_44209 [Dioszegia hungarica]|uniref:Uncharacterized protein n=1 Tax=Dioszegia hungarica TaxID=4972 RepID=A0AA38LVC4_9TREE|nr:uncharacterized protein MKK02DRAFT_44209 [Dioszegia hungarica]KAI9635519.1 hypothetical protein MKK02DRAFT_44209 [Dioszegia hungarica]
MTTTQAKQNPIMTGLGAGFDMFDRMPLWQKRTAGYAWLGLTAFVFRRAHLAGVLLPLVKPEPLTRRMKVWSTAAIGIGILTHIPVGLVLESAPHPGETLADFLASRKPRVVACATLGLGTFILRRVNLIGGILPWSYPLLSRIGDGFWLAAALGYAGQWLAPRLAPAPALIMIHPAFLPYQLRRALQAVPHPGESLYDFLASKRIKASTIARDVSFGAILALISAKPLAQLGVFRYGRLRNAVAGLAFAGFWATVHATFLRGETTWQHHFGEMEDAHRGCARFGEYQEPLRIAVPIEANFPMLALRVYI